MDKSEKIRNIFGSLIFVLAILFFPAAALATVRIDVTDHSGTDRIFHADNIYPGYAEDHTITVKNVSTASETADVYFKFDVKSGSYLADKLKLYVIRTSDNSYRIGGEGDRYTLKEADNAGALYVDRLIFDQSRNYKIKIKFDREADNSYQNKSTGFDIKFGVDSEAVAGAATPLPLRPGQAAGAETAAPGGEQEAEVKGEETGQIAGEEKCDSRPLYLFILLIAAYLIFMIVTLFAKMKDEQNLKWFWQAFATILALVVWHYLDCCKTYSWVSYVLIIEGFITYLAYLYVFKKNLGGPGRTENLPL